MNIFSISHDEDNRELILGILNRIEGYKIRLKELHWSAKSDSLHTLLDKVANTVAKYEDEMAEDYQGVFGDFEVGILKPHLPGAVDAKSLIREMREDIGTLTNFDEEVIYAGIRALSKKFVHKMNVYLYLIRRS